ncbi:branched-chain amino acid ABC transporter ATP-binding protein/permease [Pedococcus sp.]|uniref:branched-chain amino acid ABC transporter ATP-binding protein/permease n=1 Tax=Pedococcus sp. TaxID=2860345 RepID=UPI002E102F54|nr:branched-chain amino acid ABC transporter ATP-binding protein/permease [Pedococcus sp.]
MGSNGMLFYLTTLLVYGGVDALACLGLSMQFGVAGVTNFGFIIFQAAGAYAAAVLSMPGDSANGGFQTYVGGLNLPFPLPWIGAAIVGGLLALPFTFLVGRRLRGDFAAVGLLVTAVMANLLVTNYRPFLNGSAGLSLVPAPLQSSFDPQSASYQWAYSLAAVALAGAVFYVLHRLTESPYGRTLRAMRDNDVVADSLGKNLTSLRLSMLVLGGAIAGLSGAVLVGFINLWAPSGWGYAETVVLFAAVIIGGAGNHKGAILGAILVPLGFEEASRFIPPFGSPGLIPALQWVAIGLLITLFIWFRPEGVLREKRRVNLRFGLPDTAPPVPAGAGGNDAWSLPGTSTRSILTDRPTAPRHQTDDAPDSAAPTPEPQAPVLEAVDVARSFHGVPAVAGVSFALQRGRLTGLIGPNGAGKSTTLAMLAGTLPVSEGTIRYLGEDITGMPAYKRARGGLVRTFQLASEFKKLTVLENLLSAVPSERGDTMRGAILGRRYWGAEEERATEDAVAMLERFGLTQYANHYAGDLSGGQRRLVEIMRALMTRPTVLLLDEPMAGVHPHLAREMGHQLVGLCNEGMTIMMVEHELSIMDEFCDPVVVMAEGAVLAEGTMSQLRARSEVVEAYLVG